MACAPRALLWGAFLVLGLAGTQLSAQDLISEAETLLFQTDHLKNVAPPGTLSYAFRKSGSAEPGFDDTVALRVRAVDGAKSAFVVFFTGGRKIEFPEVTHAEGNPVLLCFLERDIREMQRLTGGKPGYFRKAIRMALAQSASVAKTALSGSLGATQVTITPYVNDPLKDRIGKYASKAYVFTLSADVPGGISSLRTYVPPLGGAPGDPPLIEERLSFARVETARASRRK